MAGFVSLTHRLYFMNLFDGTLGSVTSAYVGGANASFNALANASLSIDAGLTVTIQTTLDNPDAASAVWTTLGTGITSASNPYVISSPVVGIKVIRTAGASPLNVKGVGLESGGSSTVTITGTSAVAGNSASGATDSGNPVKVAGVFNTTLPTLTNGQRGDMQLDSRAELIVTQGTLIEGENQTIHRMTIADYFSPTRITAAATNTVKSGAGVLAGIYNEAVLVGTITIYDNVAASGTIIQILPIGTAAGWIKMPAILTLGCTIVGSSSSDRFTSYTA